MALIVSFFLLEIWFLRFSIFGFQEINAKLQWGFVESNSINFDIPKKKSEFYQNGFEKYNLRLLICDGVSLGLSPPAIYQLKRGQWDNLNLVEYDVGTLLDYLNEFYLNEF